MTTSEFVGCLETAFHAILIVDKARPRMHAPWLTDSESH